MKRQTLKISQLILAAPYDSPVLSWLMMHASLKIMKSTKRKIETSIYPKSLDSFSFGWCTVQIGRAFRFPELINWIERRETEKDCNPQQFVANRSWIRFKLFISQIFFCRFKSDAEFANWIRNWIAVFGQFNSNLSIQWKSVVINYKMNFSQPSIVNNCKPTASL